jgi:hypothetical protein
MRTPASRCRLLFAALVIGINAVDPQAALAGELPFVPLGPEVRINQYTGYSQDDGWVAMDRSGRSVVTWTSLADIYARLYDSGGAPRGDEFRVNQITAGTQNFARAAWQPDGSQFVVTWNDWNGNDGDLMGCFARLFDGDGQPLTPEFLVSVYTDGSQFDPDVAVGADGRFAIVWVDAGPRDGIAGISMRLYAADGTPTSDEIRVNDPNDRSQVDPAVGIDRAGQITVTYTDASDRYGEPRNILMKSFAADGTPLTPETRVNDETGGLQRWPRIAMAGDGRFVIVWQDEAGHDGDGRGVFARVFDDAQHPLTGDLPVAESPYGDQVRPIVSCDFTGNFTVVWSDSSLGDQDVLVRRFDNLGQPLMGAVEVSTSPGGDQTNPSVAVDDSGELEAAMFTSQTDIYGRWFRSPAIEQIGPLVPGVPLTLTLWLPGNAQLTYQMLASLGTDPGLDLPQSRHLALDADALFSFSIAFPSGPVFFRFREQLSDEGQSDVTVLIPADPSLSGLELWFAAVALDTNQPGGLAIRSVTRPFALQVP